MLGYVTLGTADVARAAGFYDVLLAELGAKRLYEFDRGIAWGVSVDQPSLGVLLPFNGEVATVGNGVMVALYAPSKEVVARVHALALSLGAENEGDVGPRGDGFYGGYFRDLDGHKLNVFTRA